MGRSGAAADPCRDRRIHTWLAWRDPPGRPHGVAIDAGWLDVDRDAAKRFLGWLRRVFLVDGAEE